VVLAPERRSLAPSGHVYDLLDGQTMKFQKKKERRKNSIKSSESHHTSQA
jgi:hypothetical protein